MKKIKLKSPIKKWKSWSKKKKIITSVIAIVLICVLIVSLVITKQNSRNSMPQMTASEATVTVGNISNTIVGTGNLEIDASEAIKIPSGITIKEVKVESGDSVSKGDILAVVDKTSVLEAMETVQEEIESLDEELNDSKDADETTTITTKVAGTIKKIYAKEGDSVTDCVAENGALIVIAIDGDADDTIEVMASGGTVSKINVSKNEEVSEGDTLLTIENDEETTEYKKLLEQRKELVESFKTLTAMSKNGTIVANIDGTVGEVNVTAESSSSSGSTSGSGNAQSSDTMSGTSSSVSTGTTQTTTTDSDESSYSNQITAFTLASNDTMILSVSVDELDINSVSKGQEATITLDAIEDATFTGTVTKVSNSASSSGNGVAKYTVEITIPKDEQMKSGMNASATIVIENRENILTIPVNALQERGNQSFVYTSKDSEGNLSGEVAVTTGLSDGDNVEITEGLSEGDVVYYIRRGNTSGSSFSEMFGGRFGGEMPEGMGSGGFGNRGGSGSFGGGNSGGMPQMPGGGN